MPKMHTFRKFGYMQILASALLWVFNWSLFSTGKRTKAQNFIHFHFYFHKKRDVTNFSGKDSGIHDLFSAAQQSADKPKGKGNRIYARISIFH